MSCSIIAAVDESYGIGKNGIIPWKYPEDFKWFKKKTLNSTCIMGRNTYLELADIMLGKPELLPNRNSVVVTSGEISDERVTTCNNISNYNKFSQGKDVFFIGGSSVFGYGLDVADTVYLTRIPNDYECNIFFPSEKLHANFILAGLTPLSETLNVEIYKRLK